jgi:hypothetical protein
MSLIKHSCSVCGTDLEFPEQLARVCCPQCHNHFAVEIYEDLVSLKWLKNIPTFSKIELSDSGNTQLSLPEQIKILDKEIYTIDRRVKQYRSSASSSFLVAFLFFFFALSGLLIDRLLMALCCGTVFTVMILITGNILQESAKSRKSLAILVYQRELLAREISPSQPKVF